MWCFTGRVYGSLITATGSPLAQRLTAGKCLPLALCRETVKESSWCVTESPWHRTLYCWSNRFKKWCITPSINLPLSGTPVYLNIHVVINNSHKLNAILIQAHSRNSVDVAAPKFLTIYDYTRTVSYGISVTDKESLSRNYTLIYNAVLTILYLRWTASSKSPLTLFGFRGIHIVPGQPGASLLTKIK